MMIAFHFRTKFKGHSDDTSYVVMNCKRGHDGWDDIEELDNTWIDDDGKYWIDGIGKWKVVNEVWRIVKRKIFKFSHRILKEIWVT